MIVSYEKNANGQDLVTIQIPTNLEGLTYMQTAMLDLIAHFNSDACGSIEPVYYGIQLLRALLPNYDQVKAGIQPEQHSESLNNNPQ